MWFGGALEGKADICVFGSSLAPDAAAWSAPRQLTDDPERSEQNPILFNAPDGRRLLIHTAQPGGDQDRCAVRMREVGGPPQDLPLPLGTFVRGAVHVRDDGAWLLPLFHCASVPGARWTGRHDSAMIAVSADSGGTWRLVHVPGSLGCVHMTIVDLGERLVAFFRRRQADAVHRTESLDGGESWSVPIPVDLPNNNSSIAAIRLADGRVALACNPVSHATGVARRASLYDELGEDGRPEAEGGCEAVWGTPRAPLVVAFSRDGGITFPERLVVEDGPGTCLTNDSLDGRNLELSYPSLSEGPEGLDLAYTLHRRAIRHVRIAPSVYRETP